MEKEREIEEIINNYIIYIHYVRNEKRLKDGVEKVERKKLIIYI